MVSTPVEIFFSYSHKDETFREQLELHLSMLKRQGLIKPWHDRMITAGDEWKGQIDDNLNAASIILLLITANFLASDYCYDIEMKRAMERHELGEARVLPIILAPVEGWMYSPFAKLQVLPKDGKPVTAWENRDDAFVNIAQGIRRTIALISKSQDTTDTPEKVEGIDNEIEVVPQDSKFERPDQQEKMMHDIEGTKDDHRSGGIYFGNNATVHGDVIARDKITNTTVTMASEGKPSQEEIFSKEEILKLLAELKTFIKEASINEDDKDVAVGRVAAAISEVKKNEMSDPQEARDKLGKYLEDTKGILDSVKDVGEVGGKVFPILTKIAKMLRLALI